MAQTQTNPFYEHYESYRQEGLEHRRFRQQDIMPMILSFKEQPRFTVTKEGESVEGRDIYLVKWGRGETSVLLWSQMHGDEPTATMALMDVFNFLKQEGDPLDSVRQLLHSELTLYFIPMLNPDGAEAYQRRNALGVDLNRDALRLQSPEAQLLKSLRDSLKADWGFNLHDQNILYSAGKSAKPATISLLAPPYNEESSVNEVRERAMQLIVELNRTLQSFIPGQVGKWSDEFEPRAFGDNIQKWGTSTVLIESGGYANDPEKQYIRKLNFVAMMEALQSIASGSYGGNSIEPYYDIPENERYLYNLLIRDVRVDWNGKNYSMDIGINREEVPAEGPQDFYYKSSIEELGDMSVFWGYEELEGEGMQAVPGKVYSEPFDHTGQLDEEKIYQLIRSGYTTVRLKTLPGRDYTTLPLNIIPAEADITHNIRTDAGADFVLEKDGVVRYGIINGFVYDVEEKENRVQNALVRRP